MVEALGQQVQAEDRAVVVVALPGLVARAWQPEGAVVPGVAMMEGHHVEAVEVAAAAMVVVAVMEAAVMAVGAVDVEDAEVRSIPQHARGPFDL